MKKCLLAAVIVFLAAFPLRAQFFTHGADPGRLHWYTLESSHYKMIYPEGADSLARSYARLLEQFREPVGRSLNIVTGESMWKKMPVVLHTNNVYPNGSVAYAPTRIDLFTLPDAYGSDPAPWDIQLAAHEPRHQAQLEKVEKKGIFKGLSYAIGQGASPLAWIIYLAYPRGEGDAVTVETGLAQGTRARTADFLEYIRVALDQGDFRSFTRWSKGSYKYFAPDFYKPGYMLMAGTRNFYSPPPFVGEERGYTGTQPFFFSPLNFNRNNKNNSACRIS